MLKKIFFVVCLLLILPVFSSAQTPNREWARVHMEMKDPASSEKIAEISFIFTSDLNSPRLLRFLYSDSLDRKLVYRKEHDSVNVWISMKSVASSEVLEFHINGSSITAEFGGGGFSFQDGQETSSSVRNQMTTLLSGASNGFLPLLRTFTQKSLQYETDFSVTAQLLRDLLFPDLPVSQPESPNVLITKTKPFDPQTIPPTPFEQAFGADYFN